MKALSLNRLNIMLLIALILLLSPLIAMQFTDEVNWTFGDFFIAGVLLFGTVLLCEFVLRKISNPDKRIGIIALILIVLILIWAELAVGIFGSPLAGS